MHKCPKIGDFGVAGVLECVPFTYAVEIISIDTCNRQAIKKEVSNTTPGTRKVSQGLSETEANRQMSSRVSAPISRPLVARGKKEIANRNYQPTPSGNLGSTKHHTKYNNRIVVKSSPLYGADLNEFQ